MSGSVQPGVGRVSRCLICHGPIPFGRMLCVTGPCSEPASMTGREWKPKTGWGADRKRAREDNPLR